MQRSGFYNFQRNTQWYVYTCRSGDWGGFHESFYGFRSFSDLLEEAESRGQLELEMDDRSGSYVIRALTRDD